MRRRGPDHHLGRVVDDQVADRLRPRSASRSILTASWPIRKLGIRTVVSGGAVCAANGWSLKVTSETSAGHREARRRERRERADGAHQAGHEERRGRIAGDRPCRTVVDGRPAAVLGRRSGREPARVDGDAGARHPGAVARQPSAGGVGVGIQAEVADAPVAQARRGARPPSGCRARRRRPPIRGPARCAG